MPAIEEKAESLSYYDYMTATAIAYLDFDSVPAAKEQFVPLGNAIRDARNNDPHVNITAEMLPDKWNEWEIKTIDKGISQAIVLTDNKQNIIVSFRGTRPSKMRDWLRDFQAWPHKFFTADKRHFNVAHGFWKTERDVHAEVAETVENLLQKNARANVYVTGHSLGAATGLLYRFNPE